MDAGPAKAVITDTSVDFGAADCGGKAPSSKTVTIQNTGGAPLTWSAKLDAADAFQISGLSGGTIAANGSAQITIDAKPIPSSASAGQQFLTTLAITTSDPALASLSLPVSISAQGATLTLVPAVADFGLYTVQTQAPDIALTLTNTGNKDATVAFATPTDAQFSMVWNGSPTAATVTAGGGTMAGLKARFKATSVQPANAISAIQVTGAGICGASATQVTLKGQGTNGALVYSPGTLDFGLTNCGTTALTQSFTVANNGNAPLTWTAVLSSGAPYQLSAYGGVLVPFGQQVITVTPAAIPFPSDVTANLYGATVTLTTNAVNDTPHTVTLKQTAQGAILTASATTLDFTANGKPGDTKQLTYSNVGNANANVTFNDDGQNFDVAPTTNPTTITAGGNQQYTLTAEPAHLGALNSTVSISTNTVLCKALPDAVKLTGSMTTTATALDVQGWDTCAITTGNRAYCWGYDNYYLGYAWNMVGTRNYGFPQVSAIKSASDYFNGMCAADTSGAVSCHSNNYYGGQKTAIANVTSGVTQITEAQGWFCALKADAVYCWQEGNTSASQVVASNAKYITMGYWPNSPTLGVVKTDGSFWTGSPGGSLSQVTSLSNIVAAKISPNQHICALDSSGAVWCYGYNYYGEVNGVGYYWYGGTSYVDPSTPFKVLDTNNTTPLSGAIDLSVGNWHSCAIRSDNTVVCWGYNCEGELGIGNTTCQQKGTFQTNTINDATSISSGYDHNCVLRSNGGVSCWGYNPYNNVTGASTGGYYSSPVSVPNL